MQPVILVIHLILALAIIGLVLIQRSEGGGLGIGGSGGGGLGGLSTPQGTANMLTRVTAICAGLFFCTSLLLGVLAGRESNARTSVLDALKVDTPAAAEAPVEAGAVEVPEASVPAAPIAE